MSRIRPLAYLALAVVGGLISVTGLLIGTWWAWLPIGAGIVIVAAVNLAITRDRRAEL